MQNVLRLTAFAGVLVALLTFAAVAGAQGRGANPHLTAAKEAASRDDWATALTEYLAADPDGKNPAVLKDIAEADEHLNHDDDAYEVYVRLGRLLATSKMNPRTRTALKREVDRHVAELEARPAKIAISVTEPGASVFVDDRALGTSPLSFVVRVTAGAHKVRAEKADGAKAERDVTVAAGSSEIVDLHPVLPIKKPPPPPDDHPPPAASASAAPPPDSAAPAPDPWAVPHGSVQYAAVRARTPPNIDGVLDDPIWKEAPPDNHFRSTRSKPYGQLTAEPTSVQVAYDDEYLYVAFRCGYSAPGPRDDSYPSNEATTAASAEAVAVYIDPLHDHANALGFVVSRVGARADVELTNNGADPNIDWRAIWDVATQHSPDAWTAEFRIPWGSLRIPAEEAPFTIGVNFRRRVPATGEFALWALEPPAAPGLFDTTYFGHLTGLVRVRPKLRLYLQPYAAVAFDQQAGTLRSRLDDFGGTQGNVRAYGGLYARYTPPGPFRFEASVNPDFSAVPPDQAVANFNRFELLYPEVRPFFAEDTPRFAFGDAATGDPTGPWTADPIEPVAELFYSRRVGLQTTNALTGATTSVPILYAGKAVLRTDTTEVAAMNVALSTPNPGLSFADNISALRVTENLPEGRHVGGMLLSRDGVNGKYLAGGVDGTFTLYDRHLIFAGFVAGSATQNAPSGAMGEAHATWQSQDFFANVKYLDVGSSFDPQLGYVPVIGARTDLFEVGYTPLLRTDFAQQLTLEGGLNETTGLDGVLVYDHALALAALGLVNGGLVQLQATPSIENVTTPFPLFAGRLTIPNGRYPESLLQFLVATAARQPVVLVLGYQAGDLFLGHQQTPSVEMEVNLGRFTADTLYELFYVRYGGQDFIGHQLSMTAGYSYTPLARTTLVIQANTLLERAVAQLVTSYTFGLLSTVTLLVSKSTGAGNIPSDQWLGAQAPLSAVLSFGYGLSPF